MGAKFTFGIAQLKLGRILSSTPSQTTMISFDFTRLTRASLKAMASLSKIVVGCGHWALKALKKCTCFGTVLKPINVKMELLYGGVSGLCLHDD